MLNREGKKIQKMFDESEEELDIYSDKLLHINNSRLRDKIPEATKVCTMYRMLKLLQSEMHDVVQSLEGEVE